MKYIALTILLAACAPDNPSDNKAEEAKDNVYCYQIRPCADACYAEFPPVNCSGVDNCSIIEAERDAGLKYCLQDKLK